jgi:hypothetical protein
MFYDTVGSEKRKARFAAGPLRTVGTQRPYGSTVVSTVQGDIACVGNRKAIKAKTSSQNLLVTVYLNDSKVNGIDCELQGSANLPISLSGRDSPRSNLSWNNCGAGQLSLLLQSPSTDTA